MVKPTTHLRSALRNVLQTADGQMLAAMATGALSKLTAKEDERERNRIYCALHEAELLSPELQAAARNAIADSQKKKVVLAATRKARVAAMAEFEQTQAKPLPFTRPVPPSTAVTSGDRQ